MAAQVESPAGQLDIRLAAGLVDTELGESFGMRGVHDRLPKTPRVNYTRLASGYGRSARKAGRRNSRRQRNLRRIERIKLKE